jgi:hypothetical protein
MSFRSVVILVAVLVAGAGPVWAQPVTGGAKVGANVGTLVVGDDEDDEDAEVLGHKAGLVVGGFATVPLTSRFAFQPEMLYSMKGAEEEERDGDEIETTLGFLQFPLLFRARFTAGPTRPFVVFGPAFGFRTNADTDGPGEREEDISDDTKDVEFSGVIGAGVQAGRTIVEIRYDHGFNDLDDDVPGEIRTRTVSVLIGFDFAVFRNR